MQCCPGTAHPVSCQTRTAACASVLQTGHKKQSVKRQPALNTCLLTAHASAADQSTAAQEGEEEGGARRPGGPVQANPEQRLSHNWWPGSRHGTGCCLTWRCF